MGGIISRVQGLLLGVTLGAALGSLVEGLETMEALNLAERLVAPE